MTYYILTDVAGKHGWCHDGTFMAIDRRRVPEEVQRFRTKREATRERATQRKEDIHLAVARRDVVLVAVQCADGQALVECPSLVRARAFQRELARKGIESAVEVGPAPRRAAR